MKMLTNILLPSSGSAYVDNYDIVAESSQIKKRMSICPQKNMFWHRYTVRQHLDYFAAFHNVPKQQVGMLLENLELSMYVDTASGFLSGGNKRKLMLATALLSGPKILFLDEPSAGVDPAARKAIADLIAVYKKKRTVILTTHIMDECEKLCDKMGIMVNGEFVCMGSLHDIMHRTSGYQVEISINQLAEDEIEQLKKDVRTTFSSAKEVENTTVSISFQIDAPALAIFEFIEQVESTRSVNCLVSAMKLDHLFLQYTSNQLPDQKLSEGEKTVQKTDPHQDIERMSSNSLII